jgi:uncharacterized protein
MLIVISPAKTLDLETPISSNVFSNAQLLSKSKILAKLMKQKKAHEIADLMHVSESIALLNEKRYKAWKTPFTQENARQALFTFMGDVYLGLEAKSLNDNDLAFAQEHLRILSGLYGVLRPLDLMQPYRLEMGIPLANEKGDNLYQFWDDTITKNIAKTLKSQGDNVLVNLASNEYFKAIKTKNLKAQVITPEFKEFRNGEYKMLSFFAKKARGLMARYIITQQLKRPVDLLSFDWEGYSLNTNLSMPNKPVFTR